MSALFDQIERDRADGDDIAARGLFAGRILTTATSEDDPVSVVLDQRDPYATPGCRWSPRVQAANVNVAETGEPAHNITVAQLVMPAQGDRCLVGFDDTGLPWIVSWEPA